VTTTNVMTKPSTANHGSSQLGTKPSTVSSLCPEARRLQAPTPDQRHADAMTWFAGQRSPLLAEAITP
jgi:hypothetical protein